jgi:hypothetical protein
MTFNCTNLQALDVALGPTQLNRNRQCYKFPHQVLASISSVGPVQHGRLALDRPFQGCVFAALRDSQTGRNYKAHVSAFKERKEAISKGIF